MLQNITFAKNRGLAGIRVDGITTDNIKIGIVYNHIGKKGYFVEGKNVPPGYKNNKFFNDFVVLIDKAITLRK